MSSQINVVFCHSNEENDVDELELPGTGLESFSNLKCDI